MFSVLGPLVLALAAIGIFAVVDHAVTRRTAELGLRLALGATPTGLVSAVVGQHMTIVASGVLLGWLVALIVAIAAGYVDGPVLAVVPLVLLGAAALACWIPARRAARIDPMVALRME
jgi:putative ABC transport system permease protein